MKLSKLFMLGIVGAALIVVANKLIRVERDSAFEDDQELDFDSDFIPGSKKLNLDIPEHVDPSWFRAPQRFAEDTDAMFI